MAYNLPIYPSIPVNFAEGYKERRYQYMEIPYRIHKLPWAPVFAALNITPNVLPGGKQVSTVIGAELKRSDVDAPS